MMNNLFQYTKTEGRGWLVEKPEMEKPDESTPPFFSDWEDYSKHIAALRRFKYDYPDPGKEMELGKDFEVVDSIKVFYRNDYPKGTKVAVPFNVYGEVYQKRCSKEKVVEEYFGLNPNDTHDKYSINTDFGHLVNLLYMWDEQTTRFKNQKV